jgi:CRP/FNR family cyclic AMP-dependent transcriptional regulator
MQHLAHIADNRHCAKGLRSAKMITPDYLRRIAAWSRELNEREIEIARAGIIEKSYSADEFVFMRGDHFEYWTGVVTGLARMGIVSRGGKATSFAGLTAGAWFGEGKCSRTRPGATMWWRCAIRVWR